MHSCAVAKRVFLEKNFEFFPCTSGSCIEKDVHELSLLANYAYLYKVKMNLHQETEFRETGRHFLYALSIGKHYAKINNSKSEKKVKTSSTFF